VELVWKTSTGTHLVVIHCFSFDKNLFYHIFSFFALENHLCNFRENNNQIIVYKGNGTFKTTENQVYVVEK
jgi:hypothetical protein